MTRVLAAVSMALSLAAAPRGLAAGLGADVPQARHVAVVIFENADYADVVRAPSFARLVHDGALATNSLAEIHPSQGSSSPSPPVTCTACATTATSTSTRATSANSSRTPERPAGSTRRTGPATASSAPYLEVPVSTTAAPDLTAPVVADKALAVSGYDAAAGQFKLTWAAAADADTAAGDVFYVVYYSFADELDTVAHAEARGAVLQSLAGRTEQLFGFVPSAAFYVTVVAYDVSGNGTIYESKDVFVP